MRWSMSVAEKVSVRRRDGSRAKLVSRYLALCCLPKARSDARLSSAGGSAGAAKATFGFAGASSSAAAAAASSTAAAASASSGASATAAAGAPTSASSSEDESSSTALNIWPSREFARLARTSGSPMLSG